MQRNGWSPSLVGSGGATACSGPLGSPGKWVAKDTLGDGTHRQAEEGEAFAVAHLEATVPGAEPEGTSQGNLPPRDPGPEVWGPVNGADA